ncbi:MAG: hypothetical protein ABIQ35_00845, partial [Verrucomicrobiota bacterium]
SAGAAMVITWFAISQRDAHRYDNLSKLQRTEWQTEKAQLEAALAEARVKKPGRAAVDQRVEVEKQIDPRAVVEALQKLRANSADTKSARRILHHLETLIDAGNAALPAIREFLSRNEDIDYESSLQSSLKAAKDGKIQIDFVFPPSLRFGLLDVVRQIGGADAEKLLADILGATGRGAEVAYLARVLDQMTPGKYRDIAVSIARDLLANPAAASTTGLDKYDRNFLFNLLTDFKDASFAQQAQARLIGADGAVDTGALRYLRNTLGEQSLAIVAEAYNDPRILDPAKKEPLARVALNFAGANAQANELYRAAINDPGLPVDQRRELIEDLNQDGFENQKNPTPRDLDLIKSRLDLINLYRNDVDHKVVIGAFKEAEKDLNNMLAKHASKAAP